MMMIMVIILMFDDDNAQKSSTSMTLWSKYTPFKYYYLIKKGPNQQGRGRPPPPLYGQCPFKNVFFIWTPSIISTFLQVGWLGQIVLLNVTLVEAQGYRGSCQEKAGSLKKGLIFKGNHVRGLGVGQIGAGKMREDAESNFGKSCPIRVVLQISERICKLIQMDQL